MKPSIGRDVRTPTAAVERTLSLEGFRAIAGVDEAGRGAWAGPLVAGAVILPASVIRRPAWSRTIRDSKLVPEDERTYLAGIIRGHAVAVGVGAVAPEVIDLLGLTAAGHLAMWRALRSLAVGPDYVLVDAFRIPDLTVPQRAIVHGDLLCVSIAAASIIAKTVRDGLLCELDERFPEFGYARNKGYGTAVHRAGLDRVGPTGQHRHSYAPVAAMLRP